jgi:hypothetical protein
MLIALGSGAIAKYPLGGGNWSWFLQYPLGLKALGHRVFWLEVLESSGDRSTDLSLVNGFFARVGDYGLASDCAVLLLSDLASQDINHGEAFGHSIVEIKEFARSADFLWNFCCAFREPLLSLFRHQVLIDVDPGHLQVATAAYDIDLGISCHGAHLTVGANILDRDCEIPTLGHSWRPFFPFVYLPMWTAEVPDPGFSAPFSSITQWEWEEMEFNGRLLSISKRTAYLSYASLPKRAKRPFELAANIGPYDVGNDRAFLASQGWALVDPHKVASTPEEYARYIQRCRAEIQCAKPIFRELKTGWFSDRSVCYLASGRPVLAEETGFSRRIPTGKGLLSFKTFEEALDGVREIDTHYQKHSRAARELAVEFFDSTRRLDEMIAASS